MILLIILILKIQIVAIFVPSHRSFRGTTSGYAVNVGINIVLDVENGFMKPIAAPKDNKEQGMETSAIRRQHHLPTRLQIITGRIAHAVVDIKRPETIA